GMSNLYSDLMDTIQKKTIRSRVKKIISMLVENNRDRHSRFGDSTYLLEPNLKQGQGGLRDYHTMLWIARIKSNIKQCRDLEYEGYLSTDEYKSFSHALSFIWEVRNRLHILAGRKCDQLYFEYQTQMANTLGYHKRNGQQPVERFLGKLHKEMEYIKYHHLMFLAELGYLHIPGAKKGIVTLKSKIKGLKIVRNMLTFSSPEAVVQTPLLLIEIFKESAEFSIPLSAEAKRIVKDFSHLVNNRYRSSDIVVRAFEYILVAPAHEFNVLNEMLNTGFLEHLIPEFATIVNCIQYDEYHLYPVDRHSLRTVRTLKEIGIRKKDDKKHLYNKLYKELARHRKLLLWAALLHDIGKGDHGGGHAKRGAKIAEKILSRMGYSPKEIDTVVFLVKEHLFLAKIATRRDINDEETAVFCARQIKDIRRLKMLYLITVADTMSTGPKAWNSWTETLFRDLFFKVLNTLEKGELASKKAVKVIEKKQQEVLDAAHDNLDKEDMDALVSVMSPRYLLYSDSTKILEHIRLYQQMSDREFVWEVLKDGTSDIRTVTICAKDRPGLFSMISGVLALNDLDILDARIFTWKNNIALDIFKVKPPSDRLMEDNRWARAEKHLNAALNDQLDLELELKEKMRYYKAAKIHTTKRPHRVEIDNESSSFFTIIEVFTYDYPGLLFSITHSLFKNDLDVWVSKIATKVDQVVDVFYVRNIGGGKVESSDRLGQIKTDLEEVVKEEK
ncbi:MAG: [protein-PII] uridylyltransferase, partial [Desulfobacterales bacterium]|nr:[protein-PII] uridylyltransferase [Desulfobacterales bacterium]